MNYKHLIAYLGQGKNDAFVWTSEGSSDVPNRCLQMCHITFGGGSVNLICFVPEVVDGYMCNSAHLKQQKLRYYYNKKLDAIMLITPDLYDNLDLSTIDKAKEKASQYYLANPRSYSMKAFSLDDTNERL